MTCAGGNGCGIQHGTHGRYAHGCRCEPCRTAHSTYECGRLRGAIDGGHGYVDPAPWSAIAAALHRGGGYSVRELARLCGVDRHTIERLAYGRSSKLQRGTALKLRRLLDLLPSEAV